MNKQYALSVEREYQNPYCILMPLKDIDRIFIEHNGREEEILKIIHDYDSVMIETNPDRLGIKVLINGKWKNDHQVPVVKDAFILTYSVPEVLNRIPKKEGYLKDILVHFQKAIKQESTSSLFKEILETQTLIERFEELSYEEQRLIRVYLSSKIDVHKMLGKKETMYNDIETLEIPKEQNSTLLNPTLKRSKFEENPQK